MPTVATVGPYRVFFYSADRAEPVHVHVEREDKVAKFWLNPVRLARSGGSLAGSSAKSKHCCGHEAALIGAWNEYFGA